MEAAKWPVVRTDWGKNQRQTFFSRQNLFLHFFSATNFSLHMSIQHQCRHKPAWYSLPFCNRRVIYQPSKLWHQCHIHTKMKAEGFSQCDAIMYWIGRKLLAPLNLYPDAWGLMWQLGSKWQSCQHLQLLLWFTYMCNSCRNLSTTRHPLPVSSNE